MRKEFPAQQQALRDLFNKGYVLSKRLPDNAPGRERIMDEDRPYYLHNEHECVAVHADGRVQPYTPEYR